MTNNDKNSYTYIDPELVKNGFVKLVDYEVETFPEAESIKIMTYKIPNVLGKIVNVTGLVFYPKTEKPKDGWRVVVWTHGTVGVSNACAPSLNPLNAGLKVHAESLLKDGYVIFAPDYEGLGGEGIHPYLNLSSEAKAAIYGVRTLQNHFASDFQGDWMVMGQSQGGQASLGVAEYANNDPKFKGSVAGAPASSVGRIMHEVAPKMLAEIDLQEKADKIPLEDRNSIFSYATLISYAAFIGSGMRAEIPDFDYLSIFDEHARKIACQVDDVESYASCLMPLREVFKADLIKYFTEHPDAAILDYPGVKRDAIKANDAFQKFFDKNQPGTVRIDKPILVLQGELDTNVPAVLTIEMVDNLKKMGSENIEMILVPKAGHKDAIVWRNDALVDFIEKHMPAK